VENYQAGTRKASGDVEKRSTEASKRTKIAISHNASLIITLQVFYAWIFFPVLSPLSCIALSNSILKKNMWSAARFYQKLSRMKENLFLPGNCSMSKVTGCYTAGSATPMIDVSMMIRNCASESSASAFQRPGSCRAIDACLLLL
jgi:hypothetical protein